MKRSLVMKVLFLLVLFLLSSCSAPDEVLEEPLSIYIASDLHYLAPNLIGNGDYFKNIGADGDGKVTHYSPEITEAFLSEVVENQADVLILSGDLTLNGALESHNELIKHLRVVQQAGVKVLAMAGNHDVDGAAGSYAGLELGLVDAATSDTFKELYWEFGLEQAISHDESSLSYIYEITPGLRVLMLDANCYGKGYVKNETFHWLEDVLKQAKKEHARVISVSHQNLFAHNPLLFLGYQLYNNEEILELFDKYNVKCNFSGHVHVQSIMSEDDVTEVATSSLSVSPNQYGKIIYDGKKLSYTAQQTDVSAYAVKKDWKSADFLNFSDYAKNYFCDVARAKVYQSYAESSLPEEQVTLLADTFSAVNYAYFAGASFDPSVWQEGIDLWRQQEESFTLRYIEIMLELLEKNHLSVEIDL